MGTNLPDEVPGDGLGEVAAEAEMVVAAYRTAPPTPPTNIDPAMAAAAIDLRIPFTAFSSLGWIAPEERRDLD